MAKNDPWEFVVEGAGRFPLDMLRYDACYPMRGEDVDGMDPENRDRRQVHLRSRVAGPTIKRWESFLWSVVQIRDNYGRVIHDTRRAA